MAKIRCRKARWLRCPRCGEKAILAARGVAAQDVVCSVCLDKQKSKRSRPCEPGEVAGGGRP